MSMENRKKSPQVLAIIILLVIVLVLAGYDFFQHKNSTNIKSVQSMRSVTIEIPLLADAGNTLYPGPVSGCDKVIMTDRTIDVTSTSIPSTGDLLNGAFETLFSDNTTWPPIDGPSGYAGNFIHSQTGVTFDHATLDASGVAIVYLKGQFALAGECDDPRAKTQIDYTAMQFPSVKSVVIYLNGTETPLTFSEK